ncbi:hypothetical protein PSP31121_02810 [Pandoraea sputorum]|uniref:Uncharacterized protein n=2 Tax=Pandoraea sputorum TaxID=93222 RepID=A0A5E5B346_9BURK|nr:hypothetical protein PSP31121_02810 [Pandoraea sputorum]
MGILSGISGPASAPVLLSRTPPSGPIEYSFGTDFQRLGAAPAASANAPIKPWETYPTRQRGAQDCKGISFGKWQGYRTVDKMAANRLMGKPLTPAQVTTLLERWHASFDAAVERDVVFEDRRTEVMRQVRYGISPDNVPFVRAFDPGAVTDQLAQIGCMSDEIARVDASVSPLPKGEARAMGLRNRDDLTSMRDAMLSLTIGLHERKFVELKVEIDLLISLNDMAREARRELSGDGAGTPLRLKVRGDKLMLKPATSKSRFQKNHIRARNDAARLALLLGEPANKPITLSDIHAKGFGQYEYSMVLADARTAPLDQTLSWFAERALQIDEWKQASRTLQAELREKDGGRAMSAMGGTPEQMHDDSLFDETDLSVDLFAQDDAEEVSYATIPKRLEAQQPPVAVVEAVYDILPDGSLVPERRTPSAAASAGEASTSYQRTASGRRHGMADAFIAANPGKSGRLSRILERERSSSLESLADETVWGAVPRRPDPSMGPDRETIERQWARAAEDGSEPGLYIAA